jgi:hypothetical protein
MVTQLSQDQERLLARHAAARNLTPEQALQALLDAPTPQRRPWTDQELAYLRDPHNRPRDIARKTGRSTTSISVRRNQLAHDENLPQLLRPRRLKPTPPADA